MENIETHIRHYTHLRDNLKEELYNHPGRYYSTMENLYRPILFIGTENYCKHICHIEKWAWTRLQNEAYNLMEKSLSRKDFISEKQLKHWSDIVNDRPPYNLQIV